MKIIGIAGFSGSGTTTLVVRLNPQFRHRGWTVPAGQARTPHPAHPTHARGTPAGRSRFPDSLRVGLPLNLCVMAVTITLAPWFWPFH